MGLNPKQARFAQEYVLDSNGKQAAIRAGYSPRTAEQMASRLLRNVKVAQAVAAGQKAAVDKLDISAERVLTEIAAIAFTGSKEYFDANGNLKQIQELSAMADAALAGIEVQVERSRGGKTDEETVTHIHKIRRWDKIRALEMLAKYQGLLKERIEHAGANGEALFGPMTDVDVARRLAFILKKGEAAAAERGLLNED